MNKKIHRVKGSEPLFLQRIHAHEAAEKAAREADRVWLDALTLGLSAALIKAGSNLTTGRSSRHVVHKKDIWSHLGDFIFGE